MSQTDLSLFKGFHREASNMGPRQDGSIETKRRRVAARIDAWVAVLEGRAPKKGVARLSKAVKDERHVWLKLGPESVPLNGEGDRIGVIDIDQDELVFWQ